VSSLVGHAPLAELPSHAIREADSVATVTGLGRLVEPGARLREYLLVAQPYDETAAAVETVRLSWRGYVSHSTDTPADTLHRNRLSLPYSASVNLWAGTQVGRGTVVGRGDVVIENRDGEMDYLTRLSWRGRTVEVYAGFVDDPFAEFVRIFKGQAADLQHDEQTIVLKLADSRKTFDQPLQANLYAPDPFEPYLRFDGSGDRVGMNDVLDVGTGSFAVAIRFRSTATGQRKIVDKTSGTAGYEIGITGIAGKSYIFIVNGANNVYLETSDGASDDGEWHTTALRVNRSTQRCQFVFDGAQVGDADCTAVGTLNNAVDFQLGGDGAFAFLGDIERCAVWVGTAASDATLAAFFAADKADLDAGFAGATSVYPLTENIGTSVGDTQGANDGTRTGALWSGRQSGDSRIEGQEKPLVYGDALQVEPVMVDAVKLVVQLHDGPIEALVNLDDKGDPLTAVAIGGADFWFDETGPGAGNYWVDLTTGLARLGSVPGGKLTADLNGDDTGGVYVDKAGAILRRVAADRAGLTDPDDFDVATFAALDADRPWVTSLVGKPGMTFADAFDEVLTSTYGWWVEGRDSVLRVGYLVEPDSEDVQIDSSTFADASFNRIAEHRAYQRVRVGCLRHHVTQSPTELDASLGRNRIERLGQEYKWVEESDATVVTRIADADTLAVETSLREDGDARALALALLAYFSDRREVCRVTIPGGIFLAWAGERALVIQPRFAPSPGTLALVLGVDESGARGDATITYLAKALLPEA